MKNRCSLVTAFLLLLALTLPAFVVAQQSPPAERRGNAAQDRPLRVPNLPPGTLLDESSRRAGRSSAGSAATADLEQDFAEALTLVQENYVDGNRIDYNSVFKSSIIGMLRSLDPHSNYYDPREFDELLTDQRSEYFGIGASINDRRVDDQVDTYILATFENSPAAKAGLRYGDRIVAVDGQTMRGKPSSEVRDRIRGPRGSVVKVTVERAATKRIETVEITRDAVSQPSVADAYMLKPGVGYIDMRYRGFTQTTADELQSALDRLRAQGMTSLVLDLRDNPGGLLEQSIRVADKFLHRGQVILSQKGRGQGNSTTYPAKNDSPDTTPLVILVNGGSASASEIVAGAMQDHDRALVVGETSFGKGLVQRIVPLEYGAGLTLTSAKYYTPSGRLIQRDYVSGSFYDYITRGGLGQREADKQQSAQPAKPTGPESRTDSGRVVYGGGGISPDEVVKPRETTQVQLRLIHPIFAFVRELVNGRIPGFDAYKVQRAIEFNHNLQASDFPMTDPLFTAFKNFVMSKPSYKVTAAQLDRNREFVGRQLRFEVATAAYGTTTATRVLIADDPQAAKAIEVLPRARELALMAMRGRNPQQKSFE